MFPLGNPHGYVSLEIHSYSQFQRAKKSSSTLRLSIKGQCTTLPASQAEDMCKVSHTVYGGFNKGRGGSSSNALTGSRHPTCHRSWRSGPHALRRNLSEPKQFWKAWWNVLELESKQLLWNHLLYFIVLIECKQQIINVLIKFTHCIYVTLIMLTVQWKQKEKNQIKIRRK